jgi:acyl carrier protein
MDYPDSKSSEVRGEMVNLVNKIIVHKGLHARIVIDLGSDLRRDLQLDSLDLAELTVRIQDRFGVDVFAAGVVRTWGEVLHRVDAHVTHTGRS